MQKDSERILEKHDEHVDTMAELQTEAAAAGQRLTEADKATLAEWQKEGSQILAAADRASQQETGELPRGRTFVQDVHGNLHTPEEAQAMVSSGDGKAEVSSGRTT